eukprot:CAMPEP_0175310880 /NCGR_PEP_ID=MMETSP0093-20121207/66553_1 /TAXON_ID=311494 /ORGANISM="Alexandrium monilatum, Strain CCMP3105" /LENGTH=194 /DNA_ID=CAMNT_0016607483 /DNA_START=201 /DNA_END=787 /DNA_ORIENTATION=-
MTGTLDPGTGISWLFCSACTSCLVDAAVLAAAHASSAPPSGEPGSPAEAQRCACRGSPRSAPPCLSAEFVPDRERIARRAAGRPPGGAHPALRLSSRPRTPGRAQCVEGRTLLCAPLVWQGDLRLAERTRKGAMTTLGLQVVPLVAKAYRHVATPGTPGLHVQNPPPFPVCWNCITVLAAEWASMVLSLAFDPT